MPNRRRQDFATASSSVKSFRPLSVRVGAPCALTAATRGD